MSIEPCDVVAVSLADHRVRVLNRGESPDSAEAIVRFAVMRRGVEEEFFASVRAGLYNDGDEWNGGGDAE